MPRRISDQKAAEGLLRALRTGLGQQSMLPVTQLPAGVMEHLEFCAKRDGFEVKVLDINGLETLTLVAAAKDGGYRQ